VQATYPQACAAFSGGSAASGDATESSDLDLLVVLPDEWSAISFVESLRYEGQLVEAFVYRRDGLRCRYSLSGLVDDVADAADPALRRGNGDGLERGLLSWRCLNKRLCR